MRYQVIGWRILVKPDTIDEVLQEAVQDQEFLKAAGFEVVMPESDRKIVEKSTITGEVVSVGDWAYKAYFRSVDGEKFEPPVKVGDRVTFARYAGGEWVDPDTDAKYLILNDEDIQLVLRKD